MKKNMVYFVLYIVILSELLVVITERDELEAKEHEIRDKMIVSLAKSYKQPLILSIPQRESDYSLGSEDPHRVVMTPAGLVSNEEREHIKYYIDLAEDSRTPDDWPDGGISSDNMTDKYRINIEDGNGIFLANFGRRGDYQFSAYCEVERQLPGYLPDHLMEQLEQEVGSHKTVRSEDEGFMVDVKSTGGVQRKESETFF